MVSAPRGEGSERSRAEPAQTTGQARRPARQTGDATPSRPAAQGAGQGSAHGHERARQQEPKTEQQRGRASRRQQPGRPAAQPSKAQSSRPTAGSVSLTTEQKTTIRKTVLTQHAPRVTNVNFSIQVGTVVPRTVRVVAVPATLVEIQPAWRGFMYFVNGDEIIIVEPGTLKIVAVIDV